MKKILNITSLLTILTVLILTNCRKKPESTVQELNQSAELTDSSILLNLNTIMEQDGMPTEVKVNIQNDHFFKTSKSYRAYSLKELLEPYLKKLSLNDQSEPDAIVSFLCTDGYEPILRLSDLLAAEGFIAFCDDSLSDNQCWPDSLNSKFPPFYLVWQNIPYEEQTLPWPYGLHSIKIDKTNTVYDAIYPINNEEALAGFYHFRDHCIKCHSINKIGGDMGPDFNYPKNITDYWEVEHMWNYAKNPQSFRYNARMNPITSLTREEFDEIIKYLQYVRSDKSLVRSLEKEANPN